MNFRTSKARTVAANGALYNSKTTDNMMTAPRRIHRKQHYCNQR